MALYTIFAWTAIVIAGGAYYWVYIRQAPFPTHLLGISSTPPSPESTASGMSVTSPQKRKRKTATSKRRSATSQSNELLTGTDDMSAYDGEAKISSTQQGYDERAGLAENKSLKVDLEPPWKQAKRDTHFTFSDADESDALDTPTPAPSKKRSKEISSGTLLAPSKSAAESRFERITPKTGVDDMIPEEDRPAIARVMRISSPSEQSVPTSPRPANAHVRSSTDPARDKDGLTKKQRQNQKKKERHREARAREEAIRQSQLRAHQKELETIRLNSQIKAAEKKSTQPNVWLQTGRPAMEDSVYTIQNLSEDNLTILGHRSDGAASEEGWQEVTSKAAKKAASQKSGAEKSGTEASEDMSSIEGSEEGSVPKVRPAYASGNSFADLDS